MKQPEPGTYLIRDIDPALWARFKARSEADGVTMRARLLQLVAAYADGAVAVEQRTIVTASDEAARISASYRASAARTRAKQALRKRGRS